MVVLELTLESSPKSNVDRSRTFYQCATTDAKMFYLWQPQFPLSEILHKLFIDPSITGLLNRRVDMGM